MRFDLLVSPHFRSGNRPRLLCSLLPVPTLPQVAAASVPPAVVWLGSSESITASLMGRDSKTAEATASGSASTAAQLLNVQMKRATVAWLFEQAHQLLLKDDPVAADGSIQKALGLQSAAGGTGSTFGQAGSWLILAANSLLKFDLDSCELWLRQAERTMGHQSPSVDSAEFQRLAGDLFAIRACLFAQASHYQKSACQFMEAFLCHSKAQNWCSAATDLVLRSRLLMLESKWSDAENILLQAEQTALRAEEHLSPEQPRPADVDRILRTIRLDRALAVQTERQAIIAALN